MIVKKKIIKTFLLMLILTLSAGGCNKDLTNTSNKTTSEKNIETSNTIGKEKEQTFNITKIENLTNPNKKEFIKITEKQKAKEISNYSSHYNNTKINITEEENNIIRNLILEANNIEQDFIYIKELSYKNNNSNKEINEAYKKKIKELNDKQNNVINQIASILDKKFITILENENTSIKTILTILTGGKNEKDIFGYLDENAYNKSEVSLNYNFRKNKKANMFASNLMYANFSDEELLNLQSKFELPVYSEDVSNKIIDKFKTINKDTFIPENYIYKDAGVYFNHTKNDFTVFEMSKRFNIESTEYLKLIDENILNLISSNLGEGCINNLKNSEYWGEGVYTITIDENNNCDVYLECYNFGIKEKIKKIYDLWNFISFKEDK